MRLQKAVATERTLRQDARKVVLLASVLLTATIVIVGQVVVTRVAPDLRAAIATLPVTTAR